MCCVACVRKGIFFYTECEKEYINLIMRSLIFFFPTLYLPLLKIYLSFTGFVTKSTRRKIKFTYLVRLRILLHREKIII